MINIPQELCWLRLILLQEISLWLWVPIIQGGHLLLVMSWKSWETQQRWPEWSLKIRINGRLLFLFIFLWFPNLNLIYFYHSWSYSFLLNYYSFKVLYLMHCYSSHLRRSSVFLSSYSFASFYLKLSYFF